MVIKVRNPLCHLRALGLAVGLGLAWPAARAQMLPVPHARLPLRIFTDREGIPQNSIEAIALDRLGFLWAGTQDGMVRFDGRDWRPLPLPNPQISNWVTTLLATRDGALWAGSRGDGVHRYEGGRWTSFTHQEGLGDVNVDSLAETLDPQGR